MRDDANNILVGALTPDEAKSARIQSQMVTSTRDAKASILNGLAQALGPDSVSWSADNQTRDRLYADFHRRTGTYAARASGGERGCLMLVRALAKPSNVLNDEPPTTSTLETLDVLEEMLGTTCGHRHSHQPRSHFLDRAVNADRTGGDGT